MFTHLLKLIVIPCIYASFALLQGCASVSSEAIRHNGRLMPCRETTKIGDGIVYYMPKRPIRLNYSVTDDNQSSGGKTGHKRFNVTFSLVDNSSTDTLPDVSNMFLLRYNKNYVGKNHMYMSVNRYGLLSVSRSPN